MGSRRGRISVLFSLALAATTAKAQPAIIPRARPDAPAKPLERASVRVDANLVLVPVTVCDAMNRPVTGLDRNDFRVFDDNIEQTVTAFSAEDEPVAVGLVFDVSGSMGPKIRLSRMAAAAFFGTANPEDEFFLVEFNEKPKLTVPLTRDTQEILSRLAFSQPKGRTALLDAIMLALHELKRSSKGRKALLIISDGGDNSSRYTQRELKEAVRESDVLVYAIGVYGGAVSAEEVAGPGLLTSIAEESGGRHVPGDASEMPDIAAKIGVEMRNRYLLGYSPTDPQRDGRYHPVQVKVVPPTGLPPLHASWRHGYYAPAD
ncbi:MAG: VWA domain-containing protein [Acidobacteriia bacterium]|nr:VWA domain-containing protein [Terriglobia bacterium]